MSNPVLEVQEICKIFPGVVANEDVSLSLNSGEILALLGENGAGKSTLMNIIYGLYQPSSGEILVRGKSSKMCSPRDAIGLGIGMVHQHFTLAENITAFDNITLGAEPLFSLKRNQRKAEKKARLGIPKSRQVRYERPRERLAGGNGGYYGKNTHGRQLYRVAV